MPYENIYNEMVNRGLGGGTTYTAGTGVILNGTTFQIDEAWLRTFVNNIINPPQSSTISLSTDSSNPTEVQAGKTYQLDTSMTGYLTKAIQEITPSDGGITINATGNYNPETGDEYFELVTSSTATGNYTIHTAEEDTDPETGEPYDPPQYTNDEYLYITVVSNS